jgi:FixJ family two-component response regulator
MSEPDPTVLVIDDDPDFRDSMKRLLRFVGLNVGLFASISEFLKAKRPDGSTCLVLDIKMPERSGLDFQRELMAADVPIPIIFITGHGDVPMSVQAMKRGAIEFLTKPCRDQDLIDATLLALTRDRARREHEKGLSTLRARFESLSSREREVMMQVVHGRLNKQIALEIGIAEPTVRVHRSNLMWKMNLRSLPELARIADKLNLVPKQRQAAEARLLKHLGERAGDDGGRGEHHSRRSRRAMLQGSAERCDWLVNREPRDVGRDLEQHATRFAEVATQEQPKRRSDGTVQDARSARLFLEPPNLVTAVVRKS